MHVYINQWMPGTTQLDVIDHSGIKPTSGYDRIATVSRIRIVQVGEPPESCWTTELERKFCISLISPCGSLGLLVSRLLDRRRHHHMLLLPILSSLLDQFTVLPPMPLLSPLNDVISSRSLMRNYYFVRHGCGRGSQCVRSQLK